MGGAAGQRTDEPGPTRGAPTERDSVDDVDFEVTLRLLAHELELVAREVIARAVIAATHADGAATPGVLADLVDRSSDATGKRLEIRDRQHDAAATAGHPGHLADGLGRPIEVIERSLADHRVEAAAVERKGVAPATHPVRLPPTLVAGDQPDHPEHAAGGFGRHDFGAASRHPHGVLTDAARNVEHSAPRRRARQLEGSIRHASEQELAVQRRTGRNDVTHVPVEVDDAHRAAR